MRKLNNMTDEELALAYVGGDNRAFDLLLSRNEVKLFSYIVFNRKDQTFEMYQKFDSMYGRHITGSFAIKNDPYQGYIISGSYDNGKGDWNQSYLVTRLLASGSMIWTAKDDVTDISRYKRCDEVPAEILKECKDLTEE